MAPVEAFSAAVRNYSPRVAVVLGSGLGSVPQRFEEHSSVSFADVPGLGTTSVQGHSGNICLGICAGSPILVFRGRLHFYEGHPWDRVTKPIDRLAGFGVKTLLLTNAAGGIHDSLGPGDLMILRDHLFLQAPNAWKEVAEPRNPPYSRRLIELLQQAEFGRSRELMAGVYAALTGPCYETPAEIRALKAMGADAVGMSTAAEAQTAATLGLEVAAISCITNKAAGLTAGILDHREVLANAARPAERISEILETILPLLG
ncbi:MAG TPA: purine-nucleoside phosphorylase [Gemmataceae bacterium]|nr:purine-nucleoside phosphorylase [Gemmataceae bacterium]